MNNALDVDLEDDELIAEIGLVTDLIVVASESERALDQDQIDRILGVHPSPSC
ncbi:MAG: hypothetical protein ACXVXC_02360 [Nocardioidaceae bacterium]